jgi:hypothetical protein
VSTLLLRLVDKGKVSLDDKLSKWLRDVPNPDLVTLRRVGLELGAELASRAGRAFTGAPAALSAVTSRALWSGGLFARLNSRAGQNSHDGVVHVGVGHGAQQIQVGLDILIRDDRGWRIKRPDGGYKHRGLHDLSSEFFAENDPRLVNLNFFTRLRNIIEHRYERDIAALVAGRTQAYLLNYEQTIVELFGADEGLADELRFPLFLSSITGDAVDSLKKVRARVPKGVLEWVQDFDTSVEPEIAAGQRLTSRSI